MSGRGQLDRQTGPKLLNDFAHPFPVAELRCQKNLACYFECKIDLIRKGGNLHAKRSLDQVCINRICEQRNTRCDTACSPPDFRCQLPVGIVLCVNLTQHISKDPEIWKILLRDPGQIKQDRDIHNPVRLIIMADEPDAIPALIDVGEWPGASAQIRPLQNRNFLELLLGRGCLLEPSELLCSPDQILYLIPGQ